jgi:hypothetical protein
MLYSSDDQHYYLDLVAQCQGSGDVSAGGLLVAIDLQGNFRYVQLTDLKQLRLLHREFVQEIQNSLEKEQKVLERDRDHEHTPSRGGPTR